MIAIIPRRVVYLPWWLCQLSCGRPTRVYLWHGEVRCLCQLSDTEKHQISADMLADKDDYRGRAKEKR